MEFATVEHPSGASAKVYLHGATVTSFRNAAGHEFLFVSKSCIWNGVNPIRGGIPLAFPQFAGQGPLPNHGFARTRLWELKSNAGARARLELVDNEVTREMWPYPFRLEYEVIVEPNSLTTVFHVFNTGTESFEFEALQHTYLATPAVEDVTVSGLEGFGFTDKLVPDGEMPAAGAPVTFTAETDRIYKDVSGSVQVSGLGVAATPYTVKVTPSACRNAVEAGPVDTVVWNPWTDKAKAMKDFGDEEFHSMLCVEPGRVSAKETLEAGATWDLTQVLEVFEPSKK